jgi:hypothetical protein
VYGSILAHLSFLALGAGHGSSLPFFLSSAPLGVFLFVEALFGEPALPVFFNVVATFGAPVIWATFGSLVAPSGREKWRGVTQVLALLHYASGLALVATTKLDELARLQRVLRSAPEVIILWAAIYLVGQVVLWWRTSKRSQRRPTV